MAVSVMMLAAPRRGGQARATLTKTTHPAGATGTGRTSLPPSGKPRAGDGETEAEGKVMEKAERGGGVGRGASMGWISEQ